MPLIDCPDCKQKVSDQAPTCPNCGRIIQGPPKQKKGLSPGAIILWFLAIGTIAAIALPDFKKYHPTAINTAQSTKPDSSKYPRNISTGYNYEAIRLPCKMIVINNNINHLEEPHSGAGIIGTYVAGQIVTAEKREGGLGAH